MILVDSSVWVRIEHGRASFAELLDEEDEPATCPIVVLEVLRGTRAGRYRDTRDMLMKTVMLDDPTPLLRYEEAASIYLRCRRAGVTPSTADCLVAACAIAHGVRLLHDDEDFTHITRVVPELRLFARS